MSGDALRGNLSFPPPYGPYTGGYEVTPSGETQTLETNGKLLTQDIIIHPIPYQLVTNQAGGLTAQIA